MADGARSYRKRDAIRTRRVDGFRFHPTISRALDEEVQATGKTKVSIAEEALAQRLAHRLA